MRVPPPKGKTYFFGSRRFQGVSLAGLGYEVWELSQFFVQGHSVVRYRDLGREEIASMHVCHPLSDAISQTAAACVNHPWA